MINLISDRCAVQENTRQYFDFVTIWSLPFSFLGLDRPLNLPMSFAELFQVLRETVVSLVSSVILDVETDVFFITIVSELFIVAFWLANVSSEI